MEKIIVALVVLMVGASAMAEDTTQDTEAECIQKGEQWGCWRQVEGLHAQDNAAVELLSKLQGRGLGLGSLSAAQNLQRSLQSGSYRLTGPRYDSQSK